MSSVDLTGQWEGFYSYPRLLPPVSFTATLRDRGGAIAGETHESGAGGPRFALLEGRRTGTRVTFVKSYDDGQAPIDYSGTLDSEAAEISGTWRIAGSWSGTFIMIRPSGNAEPIRQRIAERAGR